MHCWRSCLPDCVLWTYRAGYTVIPKPVGGKPKIPTLGRYILGLVTGNNTSVGNWTEFVGQNCHPWSTGFRWGRGSIGVHCGPMPRGSAAFSARGRGHESTSVGSTVDSYGPPPPPESSQSYIGPTPYPIVAHASFSRFQHVRWRISRRHQRLPLAALRQRHVLSHSTTAVRSDRDEALLVVIS